MHRIYLHGSYIMHRSLGETKSIDVTLAISTGIHGCRMYMWSNNVNREWYHSMLLRLGLEPQLWSFEASHNLFGLQSYAVYLVQ